MTQTTDAALVERMRDYANKGSRAGLNMQPVMALAADTIAAQARRIEALEAALAPFSAPPLYVYDGLPSNRFVPANQPEDWIGGGWFTAGEFDTARALLEKAPTP